jgi:hypothetical protein
MYAPCAIAAKFLVAMPVPLSSGETKRRAAAYSATSCSSLSFPSTTSCAEHIDTCTESTHTNARAVADVHRALRWAHSTRVRTRGDGVQSTAVRHCRSRAARATHVRGGRVPRATRYRATLHPLLERRFPGELLPAVPSKPQRESMRLPRLGCDACEAGEDGRDEPMHARTRDGVARADIEHPATHAARDGRHAAVGQCRDAERDDR